MLLIVAAVLVLGGGAGAVMMLGNRPAAEPAGAAGAAVDTQLPATATVATPASEPAGGSAAAAAAAHAELERIAQWTDPASGNEASARRALDAIPTLLPQLRTAADSIEARYYGVIAAIVLGQEESACRDARILLPRARAAQYFDSAVEAVVAECP